MDDHVSLFCFRGARALHFSHLNHPLRPRDDLGGIGFTSRPSDDTIFSDPEKRFALGKFGLLQVGKYSKGGNNPRFLIDLATFDLLSLFLC